MRFSYLVNMKVWRYLFGKSKSSPEDKIQKSIDTILNSKEFKTYQELFALLVPSRQVNIIDNELSIKTSENGYSESRYEFDWLLDSIEEKVSKLLETQYKIYIQQNVYMIGDNKTMIDHPVLDFVERTLKDSEVEWNEWVDKYFHHGSDGHKLFIEMNRDIPIEYNKNPPHMIWYLVLQNVQSLNTMYVRILEQPNCFEIIDQDGMSLAMVALIEDEWKYMGITTSCLEHIWELYQHCSV